jgi:hypothetical protein
MKSPKTFLLVACFIIVLTLIYVNWNQLQAAVQKMTGDLAPAGSGGSSPVATGGGSSGGSSSSGGAKPVKVGNDYNRVLRKGDSGPEVLELQKLLNRVNSLKKQILYNLAEDGKFGPLTETMLKHYGAVTSITLSQAYSRIQNYYLSASGGGSVSSYSPLYDTGKI